jgi:hypothetical protein
MWLLWLPVGQNSRFSNSTLHDLLSISGVNRHKKEDSAMNGSSRSRQVGKSIAAVVAGALVGIILSIGTDAVLHVLGVFPPLGQPAADGPLMLATAYRTAYGVAGAYITARLAPYRPMFHALLLGGLGMVASTVGAAATWNRMDAFGPHWYPVALIVLAIPTAWVGGQIHVSQLRANARA